MMLQQMKIVPVHHILYELAPSDFFKVNGNSYSAFPVSLTKLPYIFKHTHIHTLIVGTPLGLCPDLVLDLVQGQSEH